VVWKIGCHIMLCAPHDLEDRVPHDSVPYDLEESDHIV
jgi:hypothetical protein